MQCYNSMMADKHCNDTSGDARYSHIEEQAQQVVNHDYMEYIVTGVNHKPLHEFAKYDEAINELIIDGIQSKVEGIKHAVEVALRHGLETDLNELEFTGYQAARIRSQLYLIHQIKQVSEGEVFGADLLLAACCKYAHADSKIRYTLVSFFESVFDECE